MFELNHGFPVIWWLFNGVQGKVYGLRLSAWYTCSGLSQDGCWTGMIESVWPVCIWIGVGEGNGYPHALHATACHCHLVLCLWYDWLENSLVRAWQLNNFAS